MDRGVVAREGETEIAHWHQMEEEEKGCQAGELHYKMEGVFGRSPRYRFINWPRCVWVALRAVRMLGERGRRGMGPESLVVHNWIMSKLTGRSNDGAEHKELHSQTTGAAFWRTLKNQVCEMWCNSEGNYFETCIYSFIYQREQIFLTR